jgi:hypothetical protein
VEPVANAYRPLVRKAEKKRRRGRHGRGYNDNIKGYFKGIGWNGVDWIHMSQDSDK